MRKMYTLRLLLSVSTAILFTSQQGYSSWQTVLQNTPPVIQQPVNAQLQVPAPQPAPRANINGAPVQQPVNVQPYVLGPELTAFMNAYRAPVVPQPVNVQPYVPAQYPAQRADVNRAPVFQQPVNVQPYVPAQYPAQRADVNRAPVVQHPVNVQPHVPAQYPAQRADVNRVPVQQPVNTQSQILGRELAQFLNANRAPVVQQPVNVQPQAPVQQSARPGINIARIKNTILSDQVKYNRFDTAVKIDNFTAHCPLELDSEVAILNFAKRVNDEPSFRGDIVAQIREVKRLDMIAKLNNVDVTQQQDYNDSLETRNNLYAFIRSPLLNPNRNALLENIGDQDIANCIIDLKAVTGRRADQNFDSDNSLTMNTAIEILSFDRTLKHDQKRLKTEFDRKVNILQVDFSLDNPARYTIRLYPEPDLGMEAVSCLAEVENLERLFVRNPLQLNIMKMTFQDYASTIFSMEYTPVSNQEFTNLKDMALTLIDARNFTAQVDRNTNQVRQTAQQMATNYWYETKNNFERVITSGNPRDFWKERIKKIFDLAPASLVASNIARPAAVNYNAQAWNTALKEQQIIVLQQINGIFLGCSTGVSQKLKLVEQAYSSVLKTISPDTEMIALVGNIVRKLKLERINELGEHLESDENRVTVPHLAMQRMRIPFGLLGTYEDVAHAAYGNPTLAQNQPIQIIKNMFSLYPQPNRLLGGYNNASRPVKPALKVKSLVQAVVDEFNVTIKYEHVKPFLAGCLHLHLDAFNSAINMENGVFIKTNPNIDLNNRRIENEFFPKTLAFYILEKLEYVKIDDRVKTVVYKLDENDRPGRYNNHTLSELIDQF